MTDETTVWKIFTAEQWGEFGKTGSFSGSPDDLRDGYIHLSTSAQLEGTLAKYFSNHSGLVVAQIATGRFADRLKWEASRGGMMFPHLYDRLELRDIVASEHITSR